MEYRRLFIMRRDLAMSPGKLAAQVAHCAEAYWTRMIVNSTINTKEANNDVICVECHINIDVLNNYVKGSFVKTVCEARNKGHLLKAKETAIALGLVEGRDFGLIYDSCRTELAPEENDGTTLTGIWFAPLPNDVAHHISKKYQLFK